MDDIGTRTLSNKGDEKYFVFKVNILKDLIWAIIIGFIISIVISIFKLYDVKKGLTESIKNINIIIYLITYLFSFFIGFLLKVIFFNCVNTKIGKAKFGIGKGFFDLLRNLLKDLERPTENDSKLKETSYFLKINNARTGRMLKFNPDNDSINLLHQVDGMISITQAEPSEWLNPTYNFFLVNNYIASIAQSIKKYSPVSKIIFSSNRNEIHFIEFEKKKKDILFQLSQLNFGTNIVQFLNDNRIFVRFYIMKEEDIENNRSIIETLIAGHDLFGCYLYFINSKVINDLLKNDVDKDRFMNFIKSVNYNLTENNDKIDLAVALVQKDLKVIYRKQDELVSKTLDTMNSAELQSFIVKLCDLLYSNYERETHLLNKSFSDKGYVLNNEFCHIYF